MSNLAADPVHTYRFWAKARPYGQPSPENVHLLEHHTADVGACFEALLAQPTIRRRLARCGGLATLDDETAARLALFAAMHDVGKVNAGFQTRVWADSDHPGGRRPGYAGHYRELVPVLLDDDAETGDWFFDALDWWWEAVDTWDDHDGETVCGLLVAALSHHGRPLALEGGLSANPRLWRDYGELRPQEQVARIGVLLHRWFPAAFDASALALPARPQFQHMFLGLCTLADWIGSNERWFPYAAEPDDYYFFSVARPAAARALCDVGLDVAAQRAAFPGALGFDALFGHERYSGAVAGQTLVQGCSYLANTSGPVRGGVARGPGLAPTGAGRDRCGADGPADPALPGALQQASTADAAAQSLPVARCDDETVAAYLIRRRHYQRGRTG